MSSSLRTLGVIPARGGSKGIPNKNIVDLGGQPLIQYSIQSAYQCSGLDDVIVSTDSVDIANLSESLGASVPFIRPAQFATDQSDSFSVVYHALQFMESKNNCIYDIVVLLQPTTPFRSSNLIDSVVMSLISADSSVDSAVTVVNVGANHPHRMYSMTNRNLLVPVCSDVSDPMMPRQDLPDIYIRSGDVYATRRDCLISKNSLIGDISLGFTVDPSTSFNIDTPQDLRYAQLFLLQNNIHS
ncbi:N-acylneuraminate cytidylyltransferase [Synechococcus sp. Minos11]|uniref:acylneuraminate cytidylyltransferase family protein n=1 Tax=Synechococcus sp. Minos11 TaxID=221341 RepID=UPI0016453270|nr:acylneuraminate cytidylyltransferase family protein [Synechococcus sp. Minos11]QNJ07687.1 N-acylneuraminate cytidylyltransferase [Synechococcus sp. Minos11]